MVNFLRVFEHDALVRNDRNLRLLRLLPAQFDHPLKGLIEEVDLESRIDYDALSYCWGDPQITKPICLSHHVESDNHTLQKRKRSFLQSCSSQEKTHFKQFQVTTNLEAALRQLRYVNMVRVIWIDAICINQKDLVERNTQVQRMSDIYSKASQVIVWLGEACKVGGPENGLGREAIQAAFQYLRCLKEKMAATDFNWNLALDDPKILPNKLVLRSVEEICQRPWFSRIWVQQEHILAKGPVEMTCGPEKMVLRPFLTAVNFLLRQVLLHETKLSSSLYHASRICNYQSAFQMRSFRRRPPYEKLLVALLRTSGFLTATNPRDKIYGLLGLLQTTKSIPGLVPDYEKDIAKLYLEISTHLMRECGSLATLQTITQYSSKQPSWVSEWNTSCSTFFDPDNLFKCYTTIDIMPITAVLRTKAVPFGSVLSSHRIESTTDNGYKKALDDILLYLQQFPLVESHYGNAKRALELLIDDLSAWSSGSPLEKSFSVKPTIFKSNSRLKGLQAIRRADHHLRNTIFVLSSGAVGSIMTGNGHYNVMTTDSVFLFPGCAQPHLLRRHSPHFRICCHCILSGFNTADKEEHFAILEKHVFEKVSII